MIITNLLYILQGENYDSGRFLKYSYSHINWFGLQKRQKLVWTLKIISIFIISWLLILLFLYLIFVFHSVLYIMQIILLYVSLPLIIVISYYLLLPLEIYLKNSKIKKAQQKIIDSKIVVIGITGSYGKTTTKEILCTILKSRYRVLQTFENINTDIGIADFVLNNDLGQYDLFIVEMGAFKKGEIAKIADMVKPKYSILTGINESHLERFGSLENIISAKFELAERTSDISVLNFDDANIKTNYEKFKINKIVITTKNEIKNIKILDNYKGLSFEISGKLFSICLLAKHNLSLLQLCLPVAKSLGIGLDDVCRQIVHLKPVKHRLEPIYNPINQVTVIDDSYNGNYLGFVSGVDVLNYSSGRKIVLTPGIVELGEKSREIHQKVGQLYSEKVDLVLLIKTNATDYIIESLEKNNFKNYKVYNSATSAHNDLPNILVKGDTIIFQNDWPDNYL